MATDRVEAPVADLTARGSAAARSAECPRRTLPVVPAVSLLVAVPGITLGMSALLSNTAGAWPSAYLGLLGLALALLNLHALRRQRRVDCLAVALAIGCGVGCIWLSRQPEYVAAWQLNGVFHKSFFEAVVLLALALPSCSLSLYYVLGATPEAEDVSRYPLLAFPVLFVVGAYALLVGTIGQRGLAHLDLQVLIRSYQSMPVDRLDPAGLSTHVLGTLLLMGLTSAIALPLGIAGGVYLSEYATGRLGGLLRFCTTGARAMSLFILGLTALSIVRQAAQSPFADLFCGFYLDSNGFKHAAGGSFLTAALVLSLVVVPVVTRATEEGCRSLPGELREGSWSLGASDSYTLGRVVLPWALPSVVTGLLLGCAEAAGDVAVLMLIGGSGEFGVGPFSEVTSLSLMIFDAKYGLATFRESMGQYQFLAALLLLALTMGLTIAAMVLKARLRRTNQGW